MYLQKPTNKQTNHTQHPNKHYSFGIKLFKNKIPNNTKMKLLVFKIYSKYQKSIARRFKQII